MAMAVPLKSPAEILGARLLKDVERDEGSLESLLKDLRALYPTPSKTNLLTHLLHPLKTHPINITGRTLPLLHHLLYTHIHTLSSTITLVDLTHTFSPSNLTPLLTPSELSHLHIFRCTKVNFKVTLDGLGTYMMGEGARGSRGREWVGTVVLGGSGGGDWNFGWRGGVWVERVGRVEEEGGFGEAVSVEEAVGERMRRRDGGGDGHHGEEEGVRWKVVSESGEYSWISS